MKKMRIRKRSSMSELLARMSSHCHDWQIFEQPEHALRLDFVLRSEILTSLKVLMHISLERRRPPEMQREIALFNLLHTFGSTRRSRRRSSAVRPRSLSPKSSKDLRKEYSRDTRPKQERRSTRRSNRLRNAEEAIIRGDRQICVEKDLQHMYRFTDAWMGFFCMPHS